MRSQMQKCLLILTAALTYVHSYSKVKSLIQTSSHALSSQSIPPQQYCQNTITQIMNQGAIESNPTQVLLDFVYQYCHQNSDQFQKSVIPYFCYYTGLNLVTKLAPLEPSKQTPLIFQFCDTFGEGYQQRKRLLSRIYLNSEETFIPQCSEYYETQYDQEISKFDPVDMSGRLETSNLCESLLKLRDNLKQHKKDSLADLIRYSYLLSLQSYLEYNQANDYGRCEEISAKKDTFCLSFFNWKSDFSLWSQSQTQILCGKILTSQKSQPFVDDHCAFQIARLYSSYNQYLDKILDEILSKEIKALNKELDKAFEDQEKKNQAKKEDLAKVSKWLDELKIMEEKNSEQRNIDLLREQALELETERNKTLQKVDQLREFMNDLVSQAEQNEANLNLELLKQELANFRKKQDELLRKINPEAIKQQEQAMTHFIEDMIKQEEEAGMEDLRKAIQFRESFSKVSRFLRELLDFENDKALEKEIEKQFQDIVHHADSKSLKEQDDNVKFNYGDVEKISSFIDDISKNLKEIENSTTVITTKNNSQNTNTHSKVSDSSDEETILNNKKQVLQFLEQVLKDQQININKNQVLTFLDEVYQYLNIRKEEATKKKNELDKFIDSISGNSTKPPIAKDDSNKKQENNDTSVVQVAIQLKRVKEFIDNLLDQEIWNENLDKIKAFIDEITPKIDNQSLQRVLDFIQDLISKNEQDTQLLKVLDFLEGLNNFAKDIKKINDNKTITEENEVNKLIDDLKPNKTDNNQKTKDDNVSDLDIDDLIGSNDHHETKKNTTSEQERMVDDFINSINHSDVVADDSDKPANSTTAVKDLQGFLQSKLDSKTVSRDEESKIRQLQDILDKYDVQNRKEKVVNFIDDMIRGQHSSQVKKAILEVDDVSRYLNMYEQDLKERKRLAQTKNNNHQNGRGSRVGGQHKTSMYSSLLADFDKIKNK